MLSPADARDLLLDFDVCDDDPQARAFLAGLITSGMAPSDEVAKLCNVFDGDGAAQATTKRKWRKKKRNRSSTPEGEQQQPTQAPTLGDHEVSPFFGVKEEEEEGKQDTVCQTGSSTTNTVVVITRTTVLWPESRDDGNNAGDSGGRGQDEEHRGLLKTEPSTPSPRKTLRTTTPTTVSPFFAPSPATPQTPGTPSLLRSRRRRPGGCVSGLPVPPLDAPAFGLVQERLAADPFWLLVACVFLTRVAGRVSLPVFWAVRARYPSPEALAAAPTTDLAASMRHLGMAAVRSTAIQRLARRWLAQPPRPGVGTVVRGYGDVERQGRGDDDGDDDNAAAPEIGHITQGPYSIDSWRIFCRDIFLGRSTDWKGDDISSGTASGRPFQPEWMRVRPRDKELRACLRWMWMREGWEWDPATGERTVLRETLRQAVDEGRVDYDNEGGLQIVDDEDE